MKGKNSGNGVKAANKECTCLEISVSKPIPQVIVMEYISCNFLKYLEKSFVKRFTNH